MNTNSDNSRQLAEAIAAFEVWCDANESKDLENYLSVADLPSDLATELRAHFEREKNIGELFGKADSEGEKRVENTPMPRTDKRREQIGRYKLLQKIGEGGMGSVWMAEQQEPVKRRVALKVIKEGMDSEQIIARFEAERQALALMDHPNIAKVLDGGTTDDGCPYFVMELVKGVPFLEYCDQNRIGIEKRLSLFAQVCQAVHHAHQKGIIHRDIKPSNVLIAPFDGEPVPKVIDFGLAKAVNHLVLTEKTLFTEFGQVVGTLQYMSPEQAELNALDVDTRTDIYSLGVMLYELLTGTTPIEKERFQYDAFLQIMAMIKEVEPPVPSTRINTSKQTAATISGQRQIEPRKLEQILKGDLDWIVMQAISKDRDRRYATANDFANDINNFLCNETVSARPASTAYRLKKFTQKNKGLVTALTAILLLFLAGIGGTSWGLIQARRQTALAIELQEKAEQEARNSKQILSILTKLFKSIDPVTGNAFDMNARDAMVLVSKEIESLDLDKEAKASMLYSLGAAFLGSGKYASAISALRDCFDIRHGVLGPEHPDTVKALHNLASAYDATGQRTIGLELREKVLALRKKIHGIEHAETLWAMHNLAVSYELAGRQAEALDLRENVTTLRRKILGPEHPDTLRAIGNLAVSYKAVGRLEEAVVLLEKVLPLKERVFGDEHPATLWTMNYLASLYAASGRRQTSLELRENVLALRKKVLGPGHPDTLLTMSSLASNYFDFERYSEAFALREKVLKLRQNTLGPDHPETIAARNIVMWQKVSSAASFKEFPINDIELEQFREITKKHPKGMYYNTLGAAEYRMGNYEEAIAAAQKSAELLPSELNLPSIYPGDYAILAMSQFKLGEKDKANEYVEKLEEAMKLKAFKDDYDCISFATELRQLLNRNYSAEKTGAKN